jgi:hypothetical protein
MYTNYMAFLRRISYRDIVFTNNLWQELFNLCDNLGGLTISLYMLVLELN